MRFCWCCRLCLMMLRRVNICSVHERPFLNPACSSLRVQSTASCSLFSSTLLKTLPGVDSSVIPRQLLQSLRLPFFGSLIITPSDLLGPQSPAISCWIVYDSNQRIRFWMYLNSSWTIFLDPRPFEAEFFSLLSFFYCFFLVFSLFSLFCFWNYIGYTRPSLRTTCFILGVMLILTQSDPYNPDLYRTVIDLKNQPTNRTLVCCNVFRLSQFPWCIGQCRCSSSISDAWWELWYGHICYGDRYITISIMHLKWNCNSCTDRWIMGIVNILL